MRHLRRLLIAALAFTALAGLPAAGVAVIEISPATDSSQAGFLQSVLTDFLGINGRDNATVISGQATVLVTPPKADPSFKSTVVTNRMSILYATDPSVRGILAGSSQMPALPWLFRQEPSNSGPGAQLGANNSQRMAKLSGARLAKMKSVVQVADALRKGVDRTCVTPAGINTCPAHILAVDEITSAFGRVEGDENSQTAGRLLKHAMEDLAKTPSPWGGSYASRIHFYLAPGVSTAIAAGKGSTHNRGADGKEHWPDYTFAVDALARAGGVWIEMYHYPQRGAARTPFTSAEWRTVPTAVAAFMSERLAAQSLSGIDPLQSLHFMMTETAGNDLVSGGMCLAERATGGSQEHALDFPGCNPINVCISSRASNERHSEMSMGGVTPAMNGVIRGAASQIIPLDAGVEEFPVLQAKPSGMACQWQRAQTGDVNLRILMNGPGAYRATGTEATVFGKLFRQFFIVN